MVLWEDTKKWVDQIRKATPDKQKFLQYLQIDEQSLEAWYTGHSAPPQTTTRLRQQIKLYMDQCRSERRGSGDAQHQARLTGADANHLCPANYPNVAVSTTQRAPPALVQHPAVFAATEPAVSWHSSASAANGAQIQRCAAGKPETAEEKRKKKGYLQRTCKLAGQDWRKNERTLMSSVHVVGRSSNRDLEPSSSTTSLLEAAGLPHGNLPEPQAAALSGPPSQVTQGRIGGENPNHTRRPGLFHQNGAAAAGRGHGRGDRYSDVLLAPAPIPARASVQQKVQMGETAMPQVGGSGREPVSIPQTSSATDQTLNSAVQPSAQRAVTQRGWASAEPPRFKVQGADLDKLKKKGAARGGVADVDKGHEWLQVAREIDMQPDSTSAPLRKRCVAAVAVAAAVEEKERRGGQEDTAQGRGHKPAPPETAHTHAQKQVQVVIDLTNDSSGEEEEGQQEVATGGFGGQDKQDVGRVVAKRENAVVPRLKASKAAINKASEIQEGVLETGRGVFAGVEDGQSKLGCATGVSGIMEPTRSRVLPAAETAIAAGAALPQLESDTSFEDRGLLVPASGGCDNDLNGGFLGSSKKKKDDPSTRQDHLDESAAQASLKSLKISAEGASNPVARSEDKGSRPTELQDDDDEMTTSEAEELLRQADSEAENAFEPCLAAGVTGTKKSTGSGVSPAGDCDVAVLAKNVIKGDCSDSGNDATPQAVPAMSSIDPACEKGKVENEMSSALEAGAATPAPADVDSCSRAAVALLQLHSHTAQKDLVKTLLDAAQTMTTQGQSLDGLGMDSASEGRPMRSSKRSCTQMQPFSFDDPPRSQAGEKKPRRVVKARRVHDAQAATCDFKSRNVERCPIADLCEQQEAAARVLKQCENKWCQKWRSFPDECESFRCEMVPEFAHAGPQACECDLRYIDYCWLHVACFSHADPYSYSESEFSNQAFCENAIQLMIDKLEHKCLLPKNSIDQDAMMKRYQQRALQVLERVDGLKDVFSYVLQHIMPEARCEDYDEKIKFENGRCRIIELETFLDQAKTTRDMYRIGWVIEESIKWNCHVKHSNNRGNAGTSGSACNGKRVQMKRNRDGYPGGIDEKARDYCVEDRASTVLSTSESPDESVGEGIQAYMDFDSPSPGAGLQPESTKEKVLSSSGQHSRHYSCGAGGKEYQWVMDTKTCLLCGRGGALKDLDRDNDGSDGDHVMRDYVDREGKSWSMHEECCLSHPIITEAIGESGDDPRRFVSENPVLVDDVIADVRKNTFRGSAIAPADEINGDEGANQPMATSTFVDGSTAKSAKDEMADRATSGQSSIGAEGDPKRRRLSTEQRVMEDKGPTPDEGRAGGAGGRGGTEIGGVGAGGIGGDTRGGDVVEDCGNDHCGRADAGHGAEEEQKRECKVVGEKTAADMSTESSKANRDEVDEEEISRLQRKKELMREQKEMQEQKESEFVAYFCQACDDFDFDSAADLVASLQNDLKTIVYPKDHDKCHVCVRLTVTRAFRSWAGSKSYKSQREGVLSVIKKAAQKISQDPRNEFRQDDTDGFAQRVVHALDTTGEKGEGAETKSKRRRSQAQVGRGLPGSGRSCPHCKQVVCRQRPKCLQAAALKHSQGGNGDGSAADDKVGTAGSLGDAAGAGEDRMC